ncbi:MAG: hypothetical protein ACRDZ4_12095 [Egibacteraceae bacterium]
MGARLDRYEIRNLGLKQPIDAIGPEQSTDALIVHRQAKYFNAR